MLRLSYQYHHLNNDAKKNAVKLYTGELLTQWLYNVDGTKFKHSTTVELF